MRLSIIFLLVTLSLAKNVQITLPSGSADMHCKKETVTCDFILTTVVSECQQNKSNVLNKKQNNVRLLLIIIVF